MPAQGLLIMSVPPKLHRQRVGETQFPQGKKTCSYPKTKSKCQDPHGSRPVTTPPPCCGSGHVHFLLLFLNLKAGPPESFLQYIHVSSHLIMHLKLAQYTGCVSVKLGNTPKKGASRTAKGMTARQSLIVNNRHSQTPCVIGEGASGMRQCRVGVGDGNIQCPHSADCVLLCGGLMLGRRVNLRVSNSVPRGAWQVI